jgi:tetratricopeptide (TPR) repeat protein
MVSAAEAASPEDTAKAREHFGKARIHYDLKEYGQALQEFKDAYRYVQDPVFLYNIAQCHWKLGQNREAVDFFKNYLRREPGARNRAEVERRIEELEKDLGANPTPPATPPPSTPPVGPPPGPPPATPPPLATPPGPTPSNSSPALHLEATQPPPETHDEAPIFYKKWWFWTAVGAVVVGGVVVGLAASHRQEVGTCPPGVGDCWKVKRN